MILIVTIIFFLFILTYKLPNKKFNKNKKKRARNFIEKTKEIISSQRTLIELYHKIKIFLEISIINVIKKFWIKYYKFIYL